MVKPKAGSALFWFNHDSGFNFDTRNFHVGCPVIVGNKWIANKWIKYNEQMFSYPCYRDKRYYKIKPQTQKYA